MLRPDSIWRIWRRHHLSAQCSAFLGKRDAAEAVMEMAGYLHSAKTDLDTEHLDWLYHNIACRAAIKAGDDSNPQELVALARVCGNTQKFGTALMAVQFPLS